MTLEAAVKSLIDKFSNNQQTFYQEHTVKVDAVSAAYQGLSQKLTDLENRPAPNFQALIDQNNVTIRQEIGTAAATRTTPAQVDARIATARTAIETDYNAKIAARATPASVDTKIATAKTAIETDYNTKINARTTPAQVDTKIAAARTSIDTDITAKLALKANTSVLSEAPGALGLSISDGNGIIFPDTSAVSGSVTFFSFHQKNTRIFLNIVFGQADTADADDVHWLIRVSGVPVPLNFASTPSIDFNPNPERRKTIKIHGLGSAYIASADGTMKPATAFLGTTAADAQGGSFLCIGISTLSVPVTPKFICAQVDYLRSS